MASLSEIEYGTEIFPQIFSGIHGGAFENSNGIIGAYVSPDGLLTDYSMIKSNTNLKQTDLWATGQNKYAMLRFIPTAGYNTMKGTICKVDKCKYNTFLNKTP